MKPGFELDSLVAEKVMGWRYNQENECYVKGPPERPMIMYVTDLPKYSTEIGAAWEVVEKMYRDAEFFDDRAFEIMFKRSHPSWVICSLWRQKDLVSGDMIHFEATGETAAHAACLAVLKAVGVSVD